MQTRYGAKVVVNDVSNAHAVADEIKQQGFEAIACDITVEQGDAVVQAVIDAYGRIDLVSSINQSLSVRPGHWLIHCSLSITQASCAISRSRT